MVLVKSETITGTVYDYEDLRNGYALLTPWGAIFLDEEKEIERSLSSAGVISLGDRESIGNKSFSAYRYDDSLYLSKGEANHFTFDKLYVINEEQLILVGDRHPLRPQKVNWETDSTNHVIEVYTKGFENKSREKISVSPSLVLEDDMFDAFEQNKVEYVERIV